MAVKRVRISKAGEATSFLREVHTLASLRHPNVMPFYGALSSCATSLPWYWLAQGGLQAHEEDLACQPVL